MAKKRTISRTKKRSVDQKVIGEKHTIVVVDDDAMGLKMITSVLRWDHYKVYTASSGEEAIKLFDEINPHLILLDVHMPGLTGHETLKKIREMSSQYVAIIFISGESKTEDIVKGLDAGADDYVCKPFHPNELLARVRVQLRIRQIRNELEEVNKTLAKLVITDDLTGLYNMRALYDKLDVEIARAQRYDRCVSVVMVDMDHFKIVNDQHDHLFGSFVLKEMGRIIRDNIRLGDFAARYGGDEFLVVLTDTSMIGAQMFCERLRTVVEKHVFVNGPDRITLTISLGFAITPEETKMYESKDLVRSADKGLYKSKHEGRNRVSFFPLRLEDVFKHKEAKDRFSDSE